MGGGGRGGGGGGRGGGGGGGGGGGEGGVWFKSSAVHISDKFVYYNTSRGKAIWTVTSTDR